jgi:ABC-type antimicrobial peptide transport system permease subunit
MRDVIALIVGGLVFGTIAGLALARVISTMLYEIPPNDPISIGVAGATLAIVAVVAGYLPARRAARIDPLECLRSAISELSKR